MKEPRQIEGRWWIHGQDQPAYFGTLHYDPEKGLELHVKLPGQYSFAQVLGQPKPNTTVIKGRDSHDNPVTLIGATPASTSHSGGLLSSMTRPLYAFVGADIPSWTQATALGAKVRFSLLGPWLSRHSIATECSADNRTIVTHTFSPEIQIPLGANQLLVIRSEFHTGPHASGVLLQDEPFAEFSFGQPTPVPQALRYLELPLRWLLTLFAGTPAYIDSIHLKMEAGDAELLYKNTGASQAERDHLEPGLRACYSEIAKVFPSIVQRWFQRFASLESALQCYFATIFNKHLYGNHRFLFLAQALEVYHNNSGHFSTSAQAKPDFKKRIDALAACVPESERQWLKEKLNYSNQKTLAQRLDDILKAHPVEVTKLIPDPTWFAKKIRHTRNYYTHFDPDLKATGKTATDAELGPLLMQMRTLLEICLLKDLGITGPPLDRLIHWCATAQHFSLEEAPPEPQPRQSPKKPETSMPSASSPQPS